jgi:hypothetical protein
MKTLDKNKKKVMGYIIISACFILFCVLIILSIALKGEAYNSETFCLLDKESPHTIILIDKTDSLNKNHERFVLDYINKVKNRLEVYEKLSVFVLTADSCIVPEPIFLKCNPGTGEGANELYQNPKKIKLKFDRFFSNPLWNVLEETLSDSTDDQSPILEMIRELSLRDDFSRDVPKRTLIIISDMMHHTANYSHYKCGVDYSAFAKTPYFEEVVSSLQSVDVKIVYLLRTKLNKVQGRQHLVFWGNYFQAMGGDVTDVRHIR